VPLMHRAIDLVFTSLITIRHNGVNNREDGGHIIFFLELSFNRSMNSLFVYYIALSADYIYCAQQVL
jgi:hypothetical protein